MPFLLSWYAEIPVTVTTVAVVIVANLVNKP